MRTLWIVLPRNRCKATMSVAAVSKREGTDLRKILMVVPFNALCRPLDEMFDSVEYGMRAGGSLSQLRCSTCSWAVSAIDESNAFTFLRAPEWWVPYQAGPLCQVRELSPELVCALMTPTNGLGPAISGWPWVTPM